VPNAIPGGTAVTPTAVLPLTNGPNCIESFKCFDGPVSAQKNHPSDGGLFVFERAEPVNTVKAESDVVSMFPVGTLSGAHVGLNRVLWCSRSSLISRPSEPLTEP
jgi:hypothetical protein